MSSKRLIVGIVALLISTLSFSSIFSQRAEAQVSGEMAAPIAAAIGGLFLGIGNVLNSAYTTILSTLLAAAGLVDTIITWFLGLCTTIVLGMCPGFIADILLTIVGAIAEALHGLINGIIDFILFIYTSFCGACAGMCGLGCGVLGGAIGSFFGIIAALIVGALAFLVDFLGGIASALYEALCGAGSGFFMTCMAVWILLIGIATCMPPLLNCCCLTIVGMGGWCPAGFVGLFGAIADAITRALGGFLG